MRRRPSLDRLEDTVTDPYHVEGGDRPAAAPRRRTDPGTAVLWTLAAVFVGGNAAVSVAGYDWIAAGFGSIGLVFVILAVIRQLRRRRRG